MAVDDVPVEEQLACDTKTYTLFHRDVVIAQVMVPSFAFPEAHGAEIQHELGRLRAMNRADLAVALYTSVFENASLAYFAGVDDALLERLGLESQPLRLEEVLSRRRRTSCPGSASLLRPLPGLTLLSPGAVPSGFISSGDPTSSMNDESRANRSAGR